MTSTPDSTRSGHPAHSHLYVPGQRPATTSRVGSESSMQRVKNLPGYTTPVFEGKEKQRALVETEVAAKVRGTGLRFLVRSIHTRG